MGITNLIFFHIMEIQKTNTKNIILQYGFIFGILSIALSVIAYVGGYIYTADWAPKIVISIVSIALTVAVVVMGLRVFKHQNNGFMSLSQALKIGLGITLIGGIIAVIYQYVFMTVIEPDYMTKVLDLQMNVMLEQNPDMTQQQLDLAREMTQKMSTPMITSAIGVVSYLFFGFIVSLIAGLVMKKTPSEL